MHPIIERELYHCPVKVKNNVCMIVQLHCLVWEGDECHQRAGHERKIVISDNYVDKGPMKCTGGWVLLIGYVC
ncbi:hypothetical protein Peur_005838 [Populus x canadensis]